MTLAALLGVWAAEAFVLDSLPWRFDRPSALAYADSALFVAEVAGRVWRIEGGERTLYAEGLDAPLRGLAGRGDTLFVSERGAVTALVGGDTSFSLLSDLPSIGACGNDAIALRGGELLVGVDLCEGTRGHKIGGTVILLNVATRKARITARGFFEPAGIAPYGERSFFVSDAGNPASGGRDSGTVFSVADYARDKAPPKPVYTTTAGPRGIAVCDERLGEYAGYLLVSLFGFPEEETSGSLVALDKRFAPHTILSDAGHPSDVVAVGDTVYLADFSRGVVYTLTLRKP